MFTLVKKLSFTALLGFFISALVWSCGGQQSHFLDKSQNGKVLPIIFEGASISQGIGASFSLSSRMQYFLKTNPELSLEISKKYKNKKVGFVFDYFFITNFPFWGSQYNESRSTLIKKELSTLAERFDVIFISELPNEYMVASETKQSSRKEVMKDLNHPELEFVKNQMSIGFVTKAASRNINPQLVRDQINQEIREWVEKEPGKFVQLDINRFVNDMVRLGDKEKSVLTNSGHKVGVKQLYADHLHFNDLGQTLLLNRVLIPGLLSTVGRHTITGVIPTLISEDPNRFDASWRNDVKKKVYKNNSDFENKKDGIYRLEFPSQRDFIESASFLKGSDSKANPLLSRVKLSTGLPTLMSLLIDKLDVSIPLWIEDHQITLDMRKPIQSSVVSLEEVAAGHWVGYNRDYWFLTMAGFNTTYKFDLIKTSENEYLFKWTIFPLLKGQKHGFYRQDHVSEEVIQEIETNAKSYHRLVLESKMSFSNSEKNQK